MGQADVRDAGARVEELLGQLRSMPDGGVAERAEELVRVLVELYGSGLERIVAMVEEEEDGEDRLRRLAGDRLVASLLILHELHPVPVDTRVHQALEQVRPYLGSHAGGVQYLGIDDDGVVHIRLEGSCQGCPSSTVTVKLAIETAIMKAAPEVTAVAVEGAEPEPQTSSVFVPIESIGRRPSRPEASAPDWVPVSDLADLLPGTTRVMALEGADVLVCRTAEDLYAYRSACPRCDAALDEALLEGRVLACASCRSRFDVRLAGRGLDEGLGLSLEPFPLLGSGTAVRIAIPGARR